ncbi:UNVERIFIED_CONTAM: hypothetical protein Sradi_4128700 [Sesamum radiatum]|uniref:MULE transposase domain-containing protein n=1 Tax=Sesamum radiatum TaxID=300843 RepID=A0AAW2P3Q9_SESRA
MRLRVMVERTVRAGGEGIEFEGDGRQDCEGQGIEGQGLDRDEVERSDYEGQGVELGVDDNFTEIPIQQEDSNMTDNVIENVTEIPVQNITEKGKRKLYERFLNESSSEFDDSSDEDYVQSGEESDSEAPSLMLEDIECDSDDDIFLLKDLSKKDLIKKLKKVRVVLRDWCIRNGVDLEFLRNEAARVTAKCKSWEWRIHALPIQGGPTFQIKTIKVYGGQLLVAVGRDGNHNMFPIAIVVVQVENRNTWGWFVGELLDDIWGTGTNKWSFISDRQKGLVEALKDLVPEFEHRSNVAVHEEIPQGSQAPPPLSQEQPSAKAAARGRRQSPQTTQPPAPRSTTQVCS